MNKELVLSITRHVITALGSILVARGLADSGLVETVAGAVVAVVGFIIARQEGKLLGLPTPKEKP